MNNSLNFTVRCTPLFTVALTYYYLSLLSPVQGPVPGRAARLPVRGLYPGAPAGRPAEGHGDVRARTADDEQRPPVPARLGNVSERLQTGAGRTGGEGAVGGGNGVVR